MRNIFKKLSLVLVVMSILLGTHTVYAQTSRLDLVSSNQFKLATNSIYTSLNALTNQVNNYNTNTFSVLAYGGIPDNGVTDNALAISNVWKVASVAGGTAFFPPGVYGLNAFSFGSTRLSNVKLRGPGAVFKQLTTNTTGFMLIYGGTNITFDGIIFDGQSKIKTLHFLNNSSRSIVYKDCGFFNGWGDNNTDPSGTGGIIGLDITKGCTDVRISGCTFSNFTFSTVGNSGRFAKGIFASALGGSFPADVDKNFLLSGNFIYNCYGDTNSEGDCIEFSFPNGGEGFKVNIVNNLFQGFTKRAIKLQYAGYNIIGNIINSMQTSTTPTFTLEGIGVFGSGVVANNSIEGSIARGISVSTTGTNNSGTNTVIVGNIIHGFTNTFNLGAGISARDGATNIVVANNMVDNYYNAYEVRGDAQNIIFTGNMGLNSLSAGGYVGTNGNTTAGIPQKVYWRNNYFDGGTNGVNALFGSQVVSTFNTGVSSGTWINYAAGVTGYHGFNGTLPAITTATLDFGSIVAGGSADLTITVTGAATGDTVSVSLPAAPAAGIVFNAFVSAADTVTIRASNITVAPIDPASASYTVQVFKG